MAKNTWTALNNLLADPTGWVVTDSDGVCLDLIAIDCDAETHKVIIGGTAPDGTEEVLESENAPAGVETFGNPVFEIRGILSEGDADKQRWTVQFVHAARSLAQNASASQSSLAARHIPKAMPRLVVPSKPTVKQRVERARQSLGAFLVRISSVQTEILFNDMQGIMVTANSILTIGSVSVNLRDVRPTKVELVAEGTKAPELSPFAAKLHAALAQIRASAIEITKQEVIVRFQDKPTVRISAVGILSIGVDTFNLHGQENIVACQPSA